MKQTSVMIGMVCLMAACQSSYMKIEGDVGNREEDKIYIGEIENEYYNTFKVIDSAWIKGGKFSFVLKERRPQMLFLGFGQGEGGRIFAENGHLKVSVGSVSQGIVNWKVEGGYVNKRYALYLRELYDAKQRQVLDSLDNLFYAARARDDREEMKRIKDESLPYCEVAEQAEKQLDMRWVEANKENLLGIYLYYSKLFARKDFPELEDVNAERSYLQKFGEVALQSVYRQRLEEKLDLYAGCAIGVTAPEISGVDTLGNFLKLSDFRGRYVIVDFWNSYCHWCREETPWLRKSLEVFKDKNFTILGVSNDRKKDLWLNAIKEDGSHWNHLLLSPKDSVMATYCIKGIPHVILVGPDGKILAKGMRHEELTTVPATFISQ
ncbi:MAG: AhpC/TSA family protein [Odoribacter sp.]|nr:AhpC/TSA family protein [Odoribacter sp.]